MGTEIASSRVPPGEKLFQICVMNADGTGITQLTSDPAGSFDPEWSPDGTKIAFLGREGGGFTPRDIYVMKADDTSITWLTGQGDNWNRSGSRAAPRSPSSAAVAAPPAYT